MQHQMVSRWIFPKVWGTDSVHGERFLRFVHLSYYIQFLKKTQLYSKRMFMWELFAAAPCTSRSCLQAPLVRWAEFILWPRSLCSTMQPEGHAGHTAQYMPVPAQVNCCVGHWLTDVQWSPDKDHYIPHLHTHTVHLSLKYDKLQVILLTYWLLKPWVQGPKEQAWPVQDNWLLKYNVFCKAPNAPYYYTVQLM